MEIDRFVPGLCDPHVVVREEDVQLVLTADPRPRAPRESFGELEAAAMDARGESPGSVVVRAGRPLTLLAVIHDLDREPTWREEWIVSATAAALREARWRGLTRIAMPLLGTVHGRLAPPRAAELLIEGLREVETALPPALWLEGVDEETLAMIRRGVDQGT